MKKIKTIVCKIKDLLNEKRSVKKNILFIVLGIILFLISNSIFKNTYSSKYLWDLFAIYMLILAVEYFGVLLIIFSLNKHNKLVKLFKWIIPFVVIIYSCIIGTTVEQFIVSCMVVIGMLSVIIFKKPLIIFITAFFYTVIGIVIANIIYSNATIMAYLDNNSYLIFFVFVILSMAVFYITGEQVCNYFDEVFFKEFYLKEDEKILNKKIKTSELKNYVYLLYFIFYFTYYIYVFKSNNKIEEETSILINALLITILAMYQIDWKGLFEDLNDGWLRLKRMNKKNE